MDCRPPRWRRAYRAHQTRPRSAARSRPSRGHRRESSRAPAASPPTAASPAGSAGSVVNCRPWVELLFKNNAVKTIVGKDARPAASSVDAHAGAAFLAREPLRRADQRAPALESGAAAGRDGAEFPAIGGVELRHCRGLDERAAWLRRRSRVPGEPEQGRAVVQVAFELPGIAKAAAFDRAPDERRDRRPGL